MEGKSKPPLVHLAQGLLGQNTHHYHHHIEKKHFIVVWYVHRLKVSWNGIRTKFSAGISGRALTSGAGGPQFDSRVVLCGLCGGRTPCAWILSGFSRFLTLSLFHQFIHHNPTVW